MKNSNKASAAAARLLSALLVFVMLVSMTAPTADAAASTMKAFTDAERYAGLTAEEITSLESGMKIQIRNLSAAEVDKYLLRFGNGNEFRKDGAWTSAGDNNWPTMEKTLAANGYPAVAYDRCRDLDAAGLAAAYGSNTLKELFEGKDKNGNTVYTDSANALYVAKNNMFKYNSETGYYTYDSKYNHAYFDTSTSKFTLYNAPLRPGAITAAHGYQSFGAFLPFNNATTDVVKITDGNGNLVSDVTFTDGAAANKNIQFEKASEQNAKPYANLHAIYNDSKTNLADNGFVMSVEFTFFVPKDGKFNGDDMIFHFSGDDDVWVYIDGVLVVDQGGTHRHTASNINFATGEVEYQHYHADGATQPDASTDPENNAAWPWPWTTTNLKSCFDAAGVSYDSDKFVGNRFADYSEHTFMFVFLERGGEASNCELSFNIPVLPDGALDVMKSVDGELSDYAAQQEFTFVLNDDNGAAVADASYSIMHADGSRTSGNKTGTDGKFKLKANERAVFEEITADANYSITEVKDTVYSTYSDGTTCTIDGQTAAVSDSDAAVTTPEFHVDYEQKRVVNFTNELKTVDLVVEKTTGDYISDNEAFDFTVNINTNEKSKETKNISLANGQRETIKVPIGADVVVTETGLAAGYKASYMVAGDNGFTEGTACSVNDVISNETVTFLNVLETNDLTISKTVDGSLGDKLADFDFTVVITAASGETVILKNRDFAVDEQTGEITFAIGHNESMVLSGIPYGAAVSITENYDTYECTATDGSSSTTDGTFSISSMTADASVAYTNVKEGAPDTGIFLDSLPYVIILALTAAGAAAFVLNKRRLTDCE